MRFTKEVHRAAHQRLRELQRGAQPVHPINGICAEIHDTIGAAACGYAYCGSIFVGMLGDRSSYPLGHDCPKWTGGAGKDRRAFAGFMADFIEHTYLGGKE